MEKITLYYIFSTIPQVLGAIIALLGAFGVYKIQDINTNLKGISNSFLSEIERDHLHNPNKNIRKFLLNQIETRLFESRIKKSIEIGDFKHLKNRINDLVTVIPSPSFKKVFNSYCDLFEKKSKFIESIKKTIKDLAIVIVFYIILIPFPVILPKIPHIYIWIFLFITFLIVYLCIKQTIKTVKESFSIEPSIPGPNNEEEIQKKYLELGKKYEKYRSSKG